MQQKCVFKLYEAVKGDDYFLLWTKLNDPLYDNGFLFDFSHMSQ